VTGHELVLEVLALVIGIALVLATGLALLAAAARRASDDRTELMR
jgi:ABC-type nickel/cobalt efflux system permease component RcnA